MKYKHLIVFGYYTDYTHLEFLGYTIEHARQRLELVKVYIVRHVVL